jgi:hypothetical protein
VTKADLKAFVKELATISELYNRPMDQGRQALYFEALSPYSITDIHRAILEHVRHPEQGHFFPMPSHLIAIIDGDREAQALRAWSAVAEAMIEHGLYASVEFADTLIMATIKDMGGWIEFCGKWAHIPNEPFLRNEFVKRYRDYRRRGLSDGLPDHLPGAIEISNRKGGFLENIPKPTLIGGPERKAISSGQS